MEFYALGPRGAERASVNMAAKDAQVEHVRLETGNEVLSPSELFQTHSRSLKIPVRGPKEFLPNDSDQQKAQLQKSLDEHWTILAEERVERFGNLVRAVWIPEEKLVKLQSPAGKFWQTMGFSHQGKQWLLPEEALYLMECGSLQVFYRDLPMSVQSGFEHFLSSDSVTLHQYQVFGHLRRLGYVVTRFKSSMPSLYIQQLNLPVTRDKQKKQLKRKRSPSPMSRRNQKQRLMDTGETAVTGQCEDDVKTDTRHRDQTTSDPPQISQAFQDSIECCPDLGRTPQRHWWTDVWNHPRLASPRPAGRQWDLSSICFPDLGACHKRSDILAAPDPRLLPGALQVGECEMSPWFRKLNLKKERLSQQEQEKQKERNRYHWDINDDREMQRCRNWIEYFGLMERRRVNRSRNRPTHHREKELTPLTQPGCCDSHRDLLNQISIIPSSKFLDGASRLSMSDEWKICFNVYQPDTVAEFKKSHPGKPYTRMCVCRFDGPVPDLHVMKQLSFQSGDVPVTFALVDHGDISFYCLKEFKLPTDTY